MFSCREVVAQAPAHLEKEQERMEAMKQAPPLPRPEAPADGAAVPEPMATDLPQLTTQNPARLAKKLKQRRLAQQRGVNKATKKKANPLAGSGQFHKKKKGKRGRR
jgi:hypothetical protein